MVTSMTEGPKIDMDVIATQAPSLERTARDALSLARVSADPSMRRRIPRAEGLIEAGQFGAAIHTLQSHCPG